MEYFFFCKTLYSASQARSPYQSKIIYKNNQYLIKNKTIELKKERKSSQKRKNVEKNGVIENILK